MSKTSKNKKGNYLIKLKIKLHVLSLFSNGKDKKNLSLKIVMILEKHVAQMHLSKKIKLYRKIQWVLKILKLLNKIKFKCKKIYPNLKEFLKKILKDIKKMAKKITSWNYSWRFIYR